MYSNFVFNAWIFDRSYLGYFFNPNLWGGVFFWFLCLQAQLPFPEGGLVYDFVFDDGGLSQGGDSAGGEEEADDDAKAEVLFYSLR